MQNKKEQPKLQGLRSLDTLQPETFHTLSYRDQLVVLQNTTIKVDDFRRTPAPLTLADIDDEELKILQYLITKDDVVGPFASMAYEHPSAWQRYVSDDEEELWEAMEFAQERELWKKYTGSVHFDPHSMGAIVHAFRLVLEAEVPEVQDRLTFSPGKAIPSYIDALQAIGERKAGEYLFVGALSPLSVSGIWGVKQYLLPDNSCMRIVDIEGVLNNEAAQHYHTDFLYGRGEKTDLLSESQEVIFTNSVTPWFSNYHPSALQIRKSFFEESRRILRPKGALVMIEHPLVDPYAEDSLDTLVSQDYERMQQDLTEAGFQTIHVLPARVFDSQITTDTFLKTGTINEEKIKPAASADVEVPPSLIIAY